MGTGWYYDLGRLLLVLWREEEGAGLAVVGRPAVTPAVGLSACGRREEGEGEAKVSGGRRRIGGAVGWRSVEVC
jgi:hypothetical protein